MLKWAWAIQRALALRRDVALQRDVAMQQAWASHGVLNLQRVLRMHQGNPGTPASIMSNCQEWSVITVIIGCIPLIRGGWRSRAFFKKIVALT